MKTVTRQVGKTRASKVMVLPPEYLKALGDLAPKARATVTKQSVAESEISAGSMAAVYECIKTLAATGRDLGKDAAFIATTAKRAVLTGPQAKACRLFVARYRAQLPVKLAVIALGEVEAPSPAAKVVDAPTLSRSATLSPAPKTDGKALTPAERQARWRASKAMSALEVPGTTAERIRQAREAWGLTTAELLELALNALARDGENRRAA